jgi:hypothetical protein
VCRGRVERHVLEADLVAKGSLDADGAPHLGFHFRDSWLTDAPGPGMIFTACLQPTPRGIFGKLENVRIYAQKAEYLINQVDGQRVSPNSVPSRIKVEELNLAKSAPPAGTANPADAWRASNPYADWAKYLY